MMEPLLVEQMLTTNSIGALVYLLATKPQFVAGQGSMGLLAMYASRTAWEGLICLGAILKPLGLGLSSLDCTCQVGLVLRTVGLAISGFWWSILVISLAMSGPNEALIGIVPMLTMALTALWVMVRSLPTPFIHG